MKKSHIVTGLFSLPLVAISATLFSAFEAHVINVTAQIENGVLFVPTKEIEYGTVFPQEKLDQTFDVGLSNSFLLEVPGVQFASSVVSTAQGLRKNGTAVLPDRSDPTKALGAPQSTGTPFDNPVVAGSFYSLGFGGEIVLGFTDFIVNVPGPDITIFEITGGSSYPIETVRVEASQDGLAWTLLSAGVSRDGTADLGVLPWAKFVRLTDVSNIVPFEPTADAYDLDAVRATSRSRVGEVEYIVRQKPKCLAPDGSHPQVTEDDEGNFICPDDSVQMPLLCPYLSKHELTDDGLEGENDSEGIGAFHGLPLPWNLDTTIATQVEGALSNPSGDISDTWNIDLRVPCFVGSCAQDWPDFVRDESGDPNIDFELYKADPLLEHEVFGCDLWVEVVGIL